MAALGVAPDASLEAALPASAEALGDVAAERVRAELERLLVAPHAAEGLRLLRRSGLERVLLPDAPADAAEVVDRLPPELPLRLAAWLRGTRSAAFLGRWRLPRRTAREVERVLALHPIDAATRGDDASVRRLRRRAGGEDALARALALRRAEAPAAATLERLDVIERALERTRAAPVAIRDLALGGERAMEILGIAPGPTVGRALRYLSEWVLEDPARNEPALLEEALRAWAAADAPPAETLD